jgi:hypothetical protein
VRPVGGAARALCAHQQTREQMQPRRDGTPAWAQWTCDAHLATIDSSLGIDPDRPTGEKSSSSGISRTCHELSMARLLRARRGAVDRRSSGAGRSRPGFAPRLQRTRRSARKRMGTEISGRKNRSQPCANTWMSKNGMRRGLRYRRWPRQSKTRPQASTRLRRISSKDSRRCIERPVRR